MSAVDYRPAFCLPEQGIYALSHSIGCLPRRAEATLQRGFLEPWRRADEEIWTAWLQSIEQFRRALAKLLGGTPASYCPQANLSSALSKLVPTIPRSQRCRMFLAAEEAFPSLGFVLDRSAPFGFERRLIPRSQDVGDPATWERALTGDVAAVLVTHVHSNTGVRSPVAEITRICRRKEIFCIVDVAQSAGVLDFSIPELGADAVLGSCVKWLCGGPGAGFLWVHPERVRELEPTDVGWFSHAEPFAFDINSFTFAEDARRFWGGTPSVAPFALAAESVSVLAEIGRSEIARHTRTLRLAAHGELPAALQRAFDPERAGGSLCLRLGEQFDAVTRSLRDAGVRFDTRGDTVRLSLHIYNTADDAARVAAACHARR